MPTPMPPAATTPPASDRAFADLRSRAALGHDARHHPPERALAALPGAHCAEAPAGDADAIGRIGRVDDERPNRLMGLFARQGKGQPFDWLVVGLGNPGEKYARTRHNVGEEVVRLLAERRSTSLRGGRDNALVAETRFTGPDGPTGEDERVVLAFPITYMNESGRSVQAVVRRYRITEPERIIVVQDELDLPPGALKIKSGGGLAGHNGLRSISQHLRTQDYLRVRIGVGKPDSKHVGKVHVLAPFPKRQRELVDVAIADAADAVEMIVAEGVETAMQRYNSRR